MTDAATFWPLACEALAEGDFGQAFALLQAGTLLSAPAEQARYALLAGSLHAPGDFLTLSEQRVLKRVIFNRCQVDSFSSIRNMK